MAFSRLIHCLVLLILALILSARYFWNDAAVLSLQPNPAPTTDTNATIPAMSTGLKSVAYFVNWVSIYSILAAVFTAQHERQSIRIVK